MATIRDVAKLANVSVATVSRVLNKNGYLSAATEEKVLAAIKTLNYKPSSIARSLNNKKSGTIALLVTDITNPFFPELARAVEDIAQIYGYTVILCNTDNDKKTEKEYIETLKNKYIDGFIFATHTFNQLDYTEDTPAIVMDKVTDGKTPYVITKDMEGAKTAVQHLLDIGCTKIAHIRGPQDTLPGRERHLGYLEAVKQQPWYHEGLVIEGGFEIERSIQETKKLLLQEPDIDGIFAGNDLMAVGAMKAAHQLGKKIPHDLAIIGFDGIPLTTLIEPELSTMEQPTYKMGAIASRMLIKMIEDKPLEQRSYVLDVKLVQRASTSRASSKYSSKVQHQQQGTAPSRTDR